MPCPNEEGLEQELCAALEESLGSAHGFDSDGFEYESLAHLWNVEGNRTPAPAADTPGWYSDALNYWDKCDPSVDGMLGGFGLISTEDCLGSKQFLAKVKTLRPGLGNERVVDCGAGIGRVTKFLLGPLFHDLHLLEQSPPLIAKAPEYLGPEMSSRATFICSGMQAFSPPVGTYDVVWIQWVIGHLTDADLVSFLKRCSEALKPSGVICIKDNTFASDFKAREHDGSTEHFCVDREDSSMTRSPNYFEAIFNFAGFQVILKERQKNFPEELFPVYIYALA
eukprot:CAMPEP_0172587728 /NCGR_PEP_ID=MMETSP1068-20121228/6739_1 /TAXON_ID=35684 /ORGANISM="Pseudopedinella elastica, Strain CCMP716" /LENGTH=280 /DNA_ID=CAMNT_0013382845 /DNA_START=249 /DNA_END=1091 /DNA_ORIENTATION=+